MEIQKNADYEITFCPIDCGIEIPLPYDCCTEKTGKVGRIVYLTNRRFFDKKRIGSVRFLSRSPLSLEYREKITKNPFPQHLEILNANPIEVRNFAFQIPSTIKLEKFIACDSISDIFVQIPSPCLHKVIQQNVSQAQEQGAVIKLTLSINLPPKQGDTLGKIQVKLS